MFDLYAHPIKIIGINIGAEHHGDDLHAALDIKCVTYCENIALVELYPELRNFIFKKNDNPDLDEQAKEKEDIPTALRFPQMGAIKWDYKSTGYKFSPSWGLQKVEIDNCKLSIIKITPQNTGGIIKLEFSIHVAEIGKDVTSKLADMVKREIECDLYYVQPEDKQGKIAA